MLVQVYEVLVIVSLINGGFFLRAHKEEMRLIYKFEMDDAWGFFV